MNELIEKLLDEAELDIVWDQDNPDYKWVEGSEESLLKFAELIVGECVGIYNKLDNGNQHLGTDDYLEALQKHFGVK